MFYRLASTCYLAFANTERQKKEKAKETQQKMDKQNIDLHRLFYLITFLTTPVSTEMLGQLCHYDLLL